MKTVTSSWTQRVADIKEGDFSSNNKLTFYNLISSNYCIRDIKS